MNDGETLNNPNVIQFYPFAYALFNDELNNYCSYCLKNDITLRRCTGCAIAYFCTKQCQQYGWKDHKVECKSFRTINFIPDIEVRLLGRIVCRYRTIESGRANDDATFYIDRSSQRSIMDIWAHVDQIRTDLSAMRKFDDIYERLTKFYPTKQLLDREIVFQLHCRNYINRHAISDKAYLKEIGKGLYLDLCAYDHSCAPNTIYTCNGFIATLRKLNSNVCLLDRTTTFYTYIDLLNSKQQRRKMLNDTWYFECHCSRCDDNDEHILTAMLCPTCNTTDSEQQRLCIFGQHPYKNTVSQLITCPRCTNIVSPDKVMEAISAMRQIESIIEADEIDQMSVNVAHQFVNDLVDRFSIILPKVNVYYCKLIQKLIGITSANDYARLLHLHRDALECLQICYPHAHPTLAFHLHSMAILCIHLEYYNEAVNYLNESQQMLDTVLGADHSMSIRNRQLLNEAINHQHKK